MGANISLYTVYMQMMQMLTMKQLKSCGPVFLFLSGLICDMYVPDDALLELLLKYVYVYVIWISKC